MDNDDARTFFVSPVKFGFMHIRGFARTATKCSHPVLCICAVRGILRLVNNVVVYMDVFFVKLTSAV